MDKTLLKKIDEEMLKLLKSAEFKDEELEFLDEFVSNNSFGKMESIKKLDNKEVLIAYVCSQSKSITFDEITEFANRNEDIINNPDSEEYDTLFKTLFIVKGSKELDEDLPKEIKDDLDLINTRLAIFENTYGIDTIDFIEMLEKDQHAFGEANALLCAIKGTKEEITEIENYMRQDMIIGKPKYDFSDLIEAYNKISNYYNNKNKQRKKRLSKIKKQITNLQDLKKMYRREIEKDEITMISKMLNLVENEEIKKELIKNIYEHNLPIYKETENAYKKMSGDYKNKIKIILDKYNIKCDIKQINNNIELEDLEYELSILTKYEFKDVQTIIDIVNNTNIEIIDSINQIFNSGCITLEFIRNNPSIFNKNLKNSNYPVLLKNIKVIKDSDINPKLFAKTPEVLITENERFKNNIRVLDEYKLKGKLKKINSYRFLALDDLDIKIDKILELGFEDLLKEDLYLLNYSYTSWDKVLIMKEIGEVPKTIEELKEILKDNSYILDSELNEYKSNYSVTEEKTVDITKLEEFDNTKRTYNVNGILLSKNKIKRYTKDNKIKIGDVVKNSPISEEEYIVLFETLTQDINKVDTTKPNMI